VKWSILRKQLRTIWILTLLLACGATQTQAQDLTKLATDLAGKIHAAKHSRVTVLDFLDLDKKTTKLGQLLAFKLQAALTEPERGLTVVDQSQIAQLFDQMEKLSEGLIDPATGQEVGKIAGIEVLVVGTVMVSDNSVKLDVKALDLQTAKMIGAGSASTLRVGLVDRLAKEAEGEEAKAQPMEDASAPSKPVPAAVKSPPRTHRDQGVLFALDGCSLNGDELTCSVTVTSDRDRWFALSLGSRAWNDSGDEYGPREVTIANTRSENNCAIKQILKEVPTRLSVTFPQFGGEATNVERIRLAWKESDRCYLGDLRDVDFEKIALSANTDFSSPQTAAHSSGGKGGNTSASGKSSGGFLGKLLGKAEDAAEKIIDKKVKKVTGDDGTEDDSKPPQR
jgi:hypothetical protein